MLDPNGAISFGVSMIPGKLRIVGLNFAGSVIDEQIAETSDNGPETVAQIVGARIEQICRKARHFDKSRILGVGFAIPGFFFKDHEHMRVVDEHASWRVEPLAEMFSSRLGAPCWIENDATAAAIAEFYDVKQSTESIVTLLINYGIGAGLIVNGQPFRGAYGNAGEVGAFFPLDKPRPSGTDLIRFLQARDIAVGSLSDIDYSAEKHRRACDEWASKAGQQLASLVESAWSWFDPGMIVISGALPLPMLQRVVDEISTPTLFSRFPDRPTPIVRSSSIGPSVAAIGAAHIPLHQFATENTS